MGRLIPRNKMRLKQDEPKQGEDTPAGRGHSGRARTSHRPYYGRMGFHPWGLRARTRHIATN